MSTKKKRPVNYAIPHARFACEGWRYDEPRETQMGYNVNSAFFCKGCGEVWAQEVSPFGKFFRTVHKSCRKCSDSKDAGSILIGHLGMVDKERFDGAPFDLLIYEFLNLMEKYDERRNKSNGGR